MEPEGSLPHSQQPATCPHPKSNLISLLHCSGCTKGSVRFRGLCVRFVTGLSFYGEELLAPPQPQSCRTTPCRLSATAYSKYSQLPSISAGRSSIRNLRTRHAVVIGTHLSWCHIVVTALDPLITAPCRGDRNPLITAPCRGDRDSLITAPCRGDRDPLITVPCRGDRDPLITVPCRGDRDSLITAPCRGDRNPLITVPCRGDRDPLITVPCRGDGNPLITAPCRGDRTGPTTYDGKVSEHRPKFYPYLKASTSITRTLTTDSFRILSDSLFTHHSKTRRYDPHSVLHTTNKENIN
jgi:hypothetical protein